MRFAWIPFSFLLASSLALIGCASARAVATSEPPPAEPAATAAAPDILSPGYELESAEQWSDAVSYYARVLKEQPANASALHRLGVIATIREDHEAAASYYRRAMELDPRNAALLADAGYFLSLQKQYDAAAEMLRLAQLLDPENQRVINNLALVQGLRGEIDESLVLFRRANPPAVALQSLAAVHEQRGEWQLALACYLEARSVDPTVEVPEQVLANVDELRRGDRLAAVVESTDEPSPAATEAAEIPVAVAAPPPSRPVRQDVTVFEAPIEAELEPVVESVVATESPAPVSESDADFFPADFVATEASAPFETAFLEDDSTVEPTAAISASVEPPQETPPVRVRDAVLDGCCPVALRDVAQVIDGRPEFCLRHEGVLYTFSSADALHRFRQQPDRYVPSAAGLDVISVRSGRMQRGSLHYSTWFRNRLYLFTSAEHVDEFRADPLRYVDLD